MTFWPNFWIIFWPKFQIFSFCNIQKVGEPTGRVPEIYTNMYHLYIYIYIWVIEWLYRSIWGNILGTTARVHSQRVPQFSLWNILTTVVAFVNKNPEVPKTTVGGRNPAPVEVRLVFYPTIYRVLYTPGGAGFQPSTVWMAYHDDTWTSLMTQQFTELVPGFWHRQTHPLDDCMFTYIQWSTWEMMKHLKETCDVWSNIEFYSGNPLTSTKLTKINLQTSIYI